MIKKQIRPGVVVILEMTGSIRIGPELPTN